MSEYGGEDRRTQIPEAWHVSKSVSFGHIVSTIGLIVMAAVAYSDFNQKLSDSIKDIEFNKINIEKENTDRKADKSELKGAIRDLSEQSKEINRKLDRLIERQINNKHLK